MYMYSSAQYSCSVGIHNSSSNKLKSQIKRHDYLLFFALAHHADSLAVAAPGNVLDSATDRLKLVLQDVLFLRRVPNAYFTSHI